MLAVSCPLLTGCDSEEQKAQNAVWEAQASENAQAYIEQKYGFSASVTEAKVDRSMGMFGTTPLSDVFVKMNHDGRDFTVFITGEEKSTDGCDTYQADEIKQALFDTINSEIDGLQVLDIYPKYKSRQNMDEPLYGAYFDGSDLAGILEDGVRAFEAFYVQTDLSDADGFRWYESYRTNAKFVSCRDGEILKEDALTRNWAAPQPVYCDNSRTLSYGYDDTEAQVVYHSYDLHKYGDFYYYVSDRYNYDDGEPLEELPHIREVDPPDPTMFNGWGAMNASIISKAYTLSADSPMYVHVYYPVDKLDTDKDIDTYWDNFDCATISNAKDGTPKYSADPINTAGGYIYDRFYIQSGDPVTFLYMFDT